ncbi:MAG: hypothetical protein JWR69_4217 [Pedosphaera sp.]|nr:hypothetical protein [Pedosphaera sp.]
MNLPEAPSPSPQPSSAPQPTEELDPFWRRALIWLVGVIVLIVLFYTEENWRGKRAWEKYKHQVEAGGGTLDWTAYYPPLVPDDQNSFRAPKMASWFIGRGGNDLSRRLSPDNLYSFIRGRETNAVAELTVVSPAASIAPEDADIVLRYNQLFLTIAAPENPSQPSEPPPPTIPLIVMDEVLLSDAITNLARQASLSYVLDPKITFGPPGTDGQPAPEPIVSLRWENLTAPEVLADLLDNYKLQLIPGSKTGIARIVVRDPAGPRRYVDPVISVQMGKLIKNAIEPAVNSIEGPAATSAQSFEFVAKPLKPFKPVRIVLRADKIPDSNTIAEFFPIKTFAAIKPAVNRVRAEVAGSNSFHIYLSPPPYIAPADYLAWSDQFGPDFDLIREALKRPYARMDGNYQDPSAIPIPNFVTTRIVAQTLAQRAQCYLLLGQPEPALRELTLVHDLCRLLEARPTGRPMTLVAAMINVSVTGLYVGIVADGVRLQAWRDPQLAAIQEQLKEINLAPFLVNSLGCERASICRTVETATPKEFEAFYSERGGTNLWQKMQEPMFLFLTFAPRGWLYQNMICIGNLNQNGMDGFDLTNHLVLPPKVDHTAQEAQRTFSRFSPFTFLAARIGPNFLRASQRLAQNQTLANQAWVVCALERHHLAHGEYPETLDKLVPQFLEKVPADIIGGQLLKYRRTDNGQFVLYSIGWNEKDDGGTNRLSKNRPFNVEDPDWIWPYREKFTR